MTNIGQHDKELVAAQVLSVAMPSQQKSLKE